jgi:metal-sulfur cluster biosynthetic enzyme
LDLEDERVDITVDLRSLACENTEDLRAMHERIVRELPKKDLNVDEAANEALEVVEEMREMIEGVRELSDAFQVRKEIRDVATALGPLVAEGVDLQTPREGVNRFGV